MRDYQRRETEHDAAVAAWHEQMDAERAVVLDRLVDSAVAAERARTDSLRALIRVENCTVQAVRRWEFPKPLGGGIVIVSYPFVLTPAGGGADSPPDPLR